MAEQTEILNLTIDIDKAVADTAAYQKKVADLKKNLDDLKNSQDATTEEIIKANAEYKAAQQQLSANQKVLTQLTDAEKQEGQTLDKVMAQSAALRLERKKLDTTTAEGQKRLKEINDQLNKNTAYIKDNADEQKKQTMNVGNYKSALDGVGGALGGINPVLGNVTKSTGGLGAAFKLMLGPVGLIIAAISALVAYFKRTEEGQNSLTKITAVFNVVLQNLMDVVGKLGEMLFNAISKPKEAWEGFKKFLDGFVEFFKNTFGNVIGGYIDIWVGGLQSGFAAVGVAWQKFKGIFVDNNDKIKESQAKLDEANQKVKDGFGRIKEGAINMKNAVVDAYNAASDAVGKFIDESNKEIEQTKKLEDMKAALKKKERAELISNAKIENEIAELRANIAKKDQYSGAERLKMLEQVESLMNKQMNIELANAKQRSWIHKQEIAMSDSNIEALDKEAALDAEIIKIQTANAERRRSLERQRITAINDIQENNE
jgi:hypothetical protein